MIFPAHWTKAARVLEISLDRGHLAPIAGRSYSHVIVTFSVDEHRDWASTSMMGDFYDAASAEEKWGLPRGSARGTLPWRYVALNPLPIPQNDFHVRYPDVPFKRAHEFVLLHEIGHILHGWKEQAADDYAFARSLIPPDKAAAEKRSLWYSKMKNPLDFTWK
jgi:hypothetical protein